MADALTPLHVLVVEDCEDDYDLLLLKLKQAGFEAGAIRVDTVAEIEDALTREDWQMVISDFDLPGFDGLRALAVVRERNPEIPFFIVSGVIDEEQAVAVMKAGAQDYFSKGKLARLGSAVGRELHEAEQRRRRQEAEADIDRDRKLLRHDRIRFIDVMSHELRTPLNIINVAAGMLARYWQRMDAGARQERILEIQNAVAGMTRTIDKVLLTSRLEFQRWDLRAETFNLADWCEEFLAHSMGDTDQKGRVDLEMGALPGKVAMDQRLIEIALQNLLSNALKYSPTDSTVHLGVEGDDRGRIRFVVRDHGIGITEQDMPHVTASFYRGRNVGDTPGTGLGLAIVKACTDLHGGTLEIESQPGKGTRIQMCLPNWLQLGGMLEEVSSSRAEVTQR